MESTEVLNNLVKRLEGRLKTYSLSSPHQQIFSRLKNLERCADAFESVKRNRNPLDTNEAHARKVAKAAERLRQQSEKINADVSHIVTHSGQSLANAIDEAAGLQESKYGEEIRSAFRGMTETERHDALMQAVRDGDGEMIASVCQAPAVLTGVNPDVQVRMLGAIRESKAAAEVKSFNDLSEASETASAAQKTAQMVFAANYDVAQQEAIDRAEQAAKDAEANLQLVASN